MDCQELSTAKDATPPQGAAGRIRKSGGGRKRTATTDQTLRSDLETLIEPVTRGDPESPLRWTSKRVRRLAGELNSMGHQVVVYLQRAGHSSRLKTR